MTRWLTTLLAAAALLAPAVAAACPVCAQNTNDGKLFSYLLFTMMLLPFPVAGVVFWLIRRGQLEHGERAPDGPQQ